MHCNIHTDPITIWQHKIKFIYSLNLFTCNKSWWEQYTGTRYLNSFSSNQPEWSGLENLLLRSRKWSKTLFLILGHADESLLILLESFALCVHFILFVLHVDHMLSLSCHIQVSMGRHFRCNLSFHHYFRSAGCWTCSPPGGFDGIATDPPTRYCFRGSKRPPKV